MHSAALRNGVNIAMYIHAPVRHTGGTGTGAGAGGEGQQHYRSPGDL